MEKNSKNDAIGSMAYSQFVKEAEAFKTRNPQYAHLRVKVWPECKLLMNAMWDEKVRTPREVRKDDCRERWGKRSVEKLRELLGYANGRLEDCDETDRQDILDEIDVLTELVNEKVVQMN